MKCADFFFLGFDIRLPQNLSQLIPVEEGLPVKKFIQHFTQCHDGRLILFYTVSTVFQ